MCLNVLRAKPTLRNHAKPLSKDRQVGWGDWFRDLRLHPGNATARNSLPISPTRNAEDAGLIANESGLAELPGDLGPVLFIAPHPIVQMNPRGEHVRLEAVASGMRQHEVVCQILEYFDQGIK
ncbi:MAG: hypothetical protein IPI73_21165 [Betaproteobacteria bacterium]|nr:hypothetical protein [Betaproteobacteria bacterium]